MKDLIQNFPLQLEDAVEIAKSSSLSIDNKSISNVIICGMGGSGIGGSMISQILKPHSKVPVLVNKDYHIPEFVNENSLVVLSSYSGNTEETLENANQAIKKKAQIIGITSGGEVKSLSKKNNFDIISIPGGQPPRANLGYSLVQLVRIFTQLELIPKEIFNDVCNSIDLINIEQESIKNYAKDLAEKLVGKIPLIYSSSILEPLAIRFRQQLNENSKTLAWHHFLPEMNHNEIIGWEQPIDDLAVIFIKSKKDHERIVKRIEITEEIISKSENSSLLNIFIKGNSLIEEYLYGIHYVDWVSYYLADFKKVDAVEIKNIDYLKDKLAEF